MHTDGELVIEVEPSPCRPIQIVMWMGSGELSARTCMHDHVRACVRARATGSRGTGRTDRAKRPFRSTLI
jgi:hypothetical protein